MGTLNENIRILRQQRGLNQVEFAQKMSVTKQCVSNWENDNVLPSIEMLTKLADFFAVSTDYLLGRESDIIFNGSGLTDEQGAHIRALISDLQKANSRYTALRERGYFDSEDRS